MNKVLCQYHHW